jgi:hypothetical protein
MDPAAPYNNRELDSKFESLSKDLDHHRQHLHERMDAFEASTLEKLDAILSQTTKTNGRFNTLERWQSYVMGFCAELAMLLVPIVIYMAQKTIA